MADQNTHRSYRSLEQQAPAADSGRGGTADPLAELARLIGQSDPFADVERDRRRGGDRRQPQHPHGSSADPVSSSQPYPPYQAADPYSQAAPVPRAHSAHDPHGYQMPAGADPQAYSAQGYEPYPDQYDAYPLGYEDYYTEDGLPLDEAAYHEEETRRRRRRRIAAVAVIFGLAVIGSAGAYGYRYYFRTIASTVSPPVIKADSAPTKVMPVATASDAQSKRIYDRVNERGDGEKVVPREEKPLEIKQVAVAPATQPAYTPSSAAAPVTPGSTATVPIVAPPPKDGVSLPVASAPPGAGMNSPMRSPAPKKVRTVTIRPDMTIVPSPADRPSPVAQARPPSQSPEAGEGTRSVPVVPARPANPASGGRTANVPPPPAPARESSAAPLSLSPGSNAAPRTAAVGGNRSSAPLALAAPPSATPPTNVRTTRDGGYAVQVSSQRSEAEARASFRTLQARYPNVLGGREPFVRRVDLGNRGIYYRTLVGPFSSAEGAAQLCSSLKAAGGQCLIQRN